MKTTYTLLDDAIEIAEKVSGRKDINKSLWDDDAIHRIEAAIKVLDAASDIYVNQRNGSMAVPAWIRLSDARDKFRDFALIIRARA